MKLLMMGPQGSGKGTIGGMLAEYLRIPIISTGQILRDLPPKHPWYKEVHDLMDKGLLVNQAKVATLLQEELQKEKCFHGYIIDGWFRSMIDVNIFEPSLDKAVLLTISPETTVQRLGTRRTCSVCGKIYNTVTVRPQKEGVCDDCGGKLVQREDDTEEAIRKRLEIYNTKTKDVLEYLKRKNILEVIDGEGPPQEVFERVKTHLGL